MLVFCHAAAQILEYLSAEFWMPPVYLRMAMS